MFEVVCNAVTPTRIQHSEIKNRVAYCWRLLVGNESFADGNVVVELAWFEESPVVVKSVLFAQRSDAKDDVLKLLYFELHLCIL